MMLPSCVPATNFDECGASLNASDIEGLYEHPRVLGLGEVIDRYIAAQEDLSECESVEFIDDGKSGTNFDRDGFKQRMAEIKKGRIKTTGLTGGFDWYKIRLGRIEYCTGILNAMRRSYRWVKAD